MSGKQDLFDEALKLPASARAELAHELLVSLDEAEPGADEQWVQEIERRGQQVLDGTAQTVPLERVSAQISDRLLRRRGR
jgi:putative addiction module component (TIGR02574 family)